jgi:hypothetical protein
MQCMMHFGISYLRSYNGKSFNVYLCRYLSNNDQMSTKHGIEMLNVMDSERCFNIYAKYFGQTKP